MQISKKNEIMEQFILASLLNSFEIFLAITLLEIKIKLLLHHLKLAQANWQDKGSVVQLVRIHACHAWGRGFESRPDRS